MVHVPNNGEGRHKMLTFSTTTTTTNGTSASDAHYNNQHHHQSQQQQQQSDSLIITNHHPNHHLNSLINTVFEQNSKKETTVSDLLLPFSQEESTVPPLHLHSKNNGLNLSCIIEEEPPLNSMMTSTNILRDCGDDQQHQQPQNGNANLNLNIVSSSSSSTTTRTSSSTIEDTNNSNTLNGNSNNLTQIDNSTTTTTTTIHEEVVTRTTNGRKSDEKSKTTSTTKKTAVVDKKAKSPPKGKASGGGQKEKAPTVVKVSQQQQSLQNESLLEEVEKALCAKERQLSGESSSAKRKSPVKVTAKNEVVAHVSPTNQSPTTTTTSSGELKTNGSSVTNISNIIITSTSGIIQEEQSPAAAAAASSSSATPTATSLSSNVKQPTSGGKLATNGTKNPALKRVSFGNSKGGTMVETLIYENPVSDDVEIVKTVPSAAGGNVSNGSPTTSGGAGPSGITVTTILKTTETNDSIDSTLSGGSTGGSRPPSRVRVTFFESEKPLAVSSPESDIPDFDFNMTLPGSPITADNSTTQYQKSGEIGWDNPFRPDGDLSREADQIVELIKEGKPINEENLRSKSPSVNEVLHSTTYSFANATPGAGGKGANGTKNGTNEVQRGIVAPPNQAGVEHVTLNKKKKGCCVVQ